MRLRRGMAGALGVVLDANLRQQAAELVIRLILSQDFFYSFYLHPIRIPTLPNRIFPFRCAVARHPRAGQKTSDVNDAA